ncbi:hypothetical protein CRG98_023001 [Punica granatum]|uniref:RNase H type-1 domain-containing protein n=1 Tax=Punica granatum TaxID=22663 RepID=A0A2I0JK30_PUNGR|nr:hypothetical protein CRG98_023001 [Punica granatum]
MKKVPYSSAVGSLMYAMVCTRPDIAHSVGVVSRFLSNPGKEHWNAVKWILRGSYLMAIKALKVHSFVYNGSRIYCGDRRLQGDVVVAKFFVGVELEARKWIVDSELVPWFFSTSGFSTNKEALHEEFRRPYDEAARILQVAHDFLWVASSHWSISMNQPEEWALVGWSRPALGWFKLNTDGAARGNLGSARAGGIIRDSNGNWIGGIMHNIGISTSIYAELQGIVTGLELASSLECRKLCVETDSRVAQGLISAQDSCAPSLRSLVIEIRAALARDWEVSANHV